MFSIAPRSRAFVAGLAACSSLALGGALTEQASAATVTHQSSALQVSSSATHAAGSKATSAGKPARKVRARSAGRKNT